MLARTQPERRDHTQGPEGVLRPNPDYLEACLGVAAMSHLSESGDSCSSWRAGWGPTPGWGGGWDWASALTPAPWKAEAEDLTWGHEELGDRSAPFCPRTLRIPGLEQPSSSSTVAGGTSPCTPAQLETDAPAGLPQGRQPWGGARRG